MNLIHHKNLDQQKWYDLSLAEQMANIGSEVNRIIIWKNKGNAEYSNLAFERFLELIDLTVEDHKNRHRLKEILRVREMLANWYSGDNKYGSTDELWQKYFFAYNYLARINR